MCTCSRVGGWIGVGLGGGGGGVLVRHLGAQRAHGGILPGMQGCSPNRALAPSLRAG